MKFLTFFFALYGTQSAQSTVVYTRYERYYHRFHWRAANSKCEERGARLVVLDTEQKLKALQEYGISSSNYVSWIGFSDPDDNDIFSWLNGNVLSDNDGNWEDDYPYHDDDCGGITPDFKFTEAECSSSRRFICELNWCAPGFYNNKGECLKCTGNTVKSTEGVENSCPTVCDGVTEVPNSGHTACECNAGYYGNATSGCTMCPGNKVKMEAGDAPSCDTECGAETSGSNDDHTGCVCLPGYKKLADGYCFATNRSGIYSLEEKKMGISLDEATILQVQSDKECGVECLKRNCNRFSFEQQTPDVGMCNMTMTGSATQQPQEGAEYYVKQ